MNKFLSVQEASDYFAEQGISMKPGTLRKKVQRRELPYYDLGRPRFKISDLDRYIESKKVKAERWPSRRRL